MKTNILIDVMPLLLSSPPTVLAYYLQFARVGSHHAPLSKWVNDHYTGYTIRNGSVAAVCIYLNYFFAGNRHGLSPSVKPLRFPP